ncbi:MAG TPA: hypothetical protein VGD89_00630 [Flavipsychrobacter sp.]
MIPRPAFIIVLMMLFCGCALPKQPPLNANEKLFIGQLQESCQCEIIREVDPYIEKDSEREGGYLLLMKKLPCSVIDNRDELRSKSDAITKKLLAEVLTADFKYKFDVITIAYGCDSNNYTNSYSYDYTIENNQIVSVE